MRLDVTQQLRLQQQMKLSPRIIQAMEILQLPMLALQERIDAELMSNPVLEVQSPEADEQPSAESELDPVARGEKDMVVGDGSNQSDDFERLDQFTQEYGMDFINSEASFRPRQAIGERDRKSDAMANTAAPDQSLTEYLLDQWRFIEAAPQTKRAGEEVITNISDDGYLRMPLEDVAEACGEDVSVQNVTDALHLIQTLDPTGVGARDLKECLAIQLAAEVEAGHDVSLEFTLVQRHLGDIEKNRLPQIAKRTGRAIDDIKKAIENLSHLNPRPGTLVSAQRVPSIIPDIIVTVDESGEIVVSMSDRNSPNLGISSVYRQLARDRQTDKEARQFLRGNIRSAQWLVSAIQQRRQTVHRVAEEVFHVQSEFLDLGEEALKPLPMAQVAKRVGVHVATVSRAVSGKYVQTPRGIYPLRMFFTGGTTGSDGQEVAWDAVKAKLKEIVDAEDKSKPLNDDQLASELRKHVSSIARRTVAKYRGLLDIPPAIMRKQF